MKLFGLNITRDGAPKSRRNYDGARRDDYTADWLMTDGPSDVVSRASVATLRSRGRDLERNNPYAEAILSECESNIVGPNGFMIKPSLDEWTRE